MALKESNAARARRLAKEANRTLVIEDTFSKPCCSSNDEQVSKPNCKVSDEQEIKPFQTDTVITVVLFVGLFLAFCFAY